MALLSSVVPCFGLLTLWQKSFNSLNFMLVTTGRECTKAEKQGCLGDLYYSVFSVFTTVGNTAGEPWGTLGNPGDSS